MLVTERMRSLGEHAKSSRQPPLKERRHAKASESAEKTVDLDEDIFGAAHGGAAAVIVDDATPQTVTHENGAIVEITPDEEAAVLATVAAVLAKMEPKPPTADDNLALPKAVCEGVELSAAKRAIIHEWENWSALHSDELNDPNVAEYFFRHLHVKKPQLLNFGSQDKRGKIRGWLRVENC